MRFGAVSAVGAAFELEECGHGVDGTHVPLTARLLEEIAQAAREGDFPVAVEIAAD